MTGPVPWFLGLSLLLLAGLFGIQLSGALLKSLEYRKEGWGYLGRPGGFWLVLLLPPVFLLSLVFSSLARLAGHLTEQEQIFSQRHCPELLQHCDLFLSASNPESLLYGLGFLALLALFFLRTPRLSSSRLGRCCSGRQTPEQRLDEIQQQFWQCFSLRLPRIQLDCPSKVGASVSGLLRSTIHLSPRLMEQLSRKELVGVLLHEIAHVRRRDNLQALFLDWWRRLSLFPGVWVHFQARWRLERELACDDWATERSQAPLELGTALLKVSRLHPDVCPSLPLRANLLPPNAALLEARVHRLILRAEGGIPEESSSTWFLFGTWFFASALVCLMFSLPMDSFLLSLHCWSEDFLHRMSF